MANWKFAPLVENTKTACLQHTRHQNSVQDKPANRAIIIMHLTSSSVAQWTKWQKWMFRFLSSALSGAACWLLAVESYSNRFDRMRALRPAGQSRECSSSRECFNHSSTWQQPIPATYCLLLLLLLLLLLYTTFVEYSGFYHYNEASWQTTVLVLVADPWVLLALVSGLTGGHLDLGPL